MILETAIQDDQECQDFDSESLLRIICRIKKGLGIASQPSH